MVVGGDNIHCTSHGIKNHGEKESMRKGEDALKGVVRGEDRQGSLQPEGDI